MTDICQICCNNYNTFTRKKISCDKCEYICCVKCLRKYILNLFDDAKCINCQCVLSLDFLNNNFPKSFIKNDLKKHTKEINIKKEKLKFKETIPYVEQELKNETINNEINKLNEQKNILLKQINDLDNKIFIKRCSIDNKKPETNVNLYTDICPDENCLGYLYENKCRLCHVSVCNFCDKQLKCDESHVCKQEDIDNSIILKKNTKHCPNCRALIYKISGCRQMFCTNNNCNICFDWNTGEVITDYNKVHNPHLYQFLKDNKLKTETEKNISSRDLINLLKSIENNNDIIIKIMNFYKSINSFIVNELPKYNIISDNEFTTLRVSYMMKKISDVEWEKKVDKLNCRNKKNLLFKNLFDSYIDIGKNIILNIQKTHIIDVDEIESLRNFFNENIKKIYLNLNSTSHIKMLTVDFMYL